MILFGWLMQVADKLILEMAMISLFWLDIVLVNEEYELRIAYVTGLLEKFKNNETFTPYPNPSHGKIIELYQKDQMIYNDYIIYNRE